MCDAWAYKPGRIPDSSGYVSDPDNHWHDARANRRLDSTRAVKLWRFSMSIGASLTHR